MKSFLDKEIVVKRTIKGYIINCLVIALVVSIITFIGVYMSINLVAHINPETLVGFQQDMITVPFMIFRTTCSIVFYLLPIIISYMALLTAFMIFYENKKMDEAKKKTKKRKK